MTTVTLIGLGVVGSHAVGLLIRMGLIDRLILVDPDVYDESNLTSQCIEPRDVGRPKVLAQKRRVRAIAPGIDVTAIQSRLEDVPPGRLRADVIVTCLDSAAARIDANEIAGMLGVPLIDTGVRGADLLGRVDVYLPRPKCACFECLLAAHDYQQAEVVHSCEEGRDPRRSRPTPAPSATSAALGSLVASATVVVLEELLRSRDPGALAGRRILFELRNHRHAVSRLPFNPACRRSPHEPWAIRSFGEHASRLTFTELHAQVGAATSDAAIRIFGTRFVTEVVCVRCGRKRRVVRVERGLGGARGWCGACHRPMEVTSLGLVEWLPLAALTSRELDRALESFGLARGDVVTIRSRGTEQHVELKLPRGAGGAAQAREES